MSEPVYQQVDIRDLEYLRSLADTIVHPQVDYDDDADKMRREVISQNKRAAECILELLKTISDPKKLDIHGIDYWIKPDVKLPNSDLAYKIISAASDRINKAYADEDQDAKPQTEDNPQPARPSSSVLDVTDKLYGFVGVVPYSDRSGGILYGFTTVAAASSWFDRCPGPRRLYKVDFTADLPITTYRTTR